MKHFIKTLCCLFLVVNCYGQSITKKTTKQSIPQLTKLLSASALPYTIVNDTLAYIPYEGENIPSYQVVIQKVGDLYIIYTNLSEAIPGKLTESQYKYLLQRNDEFDLVKIGLGEDGIFYLRGDIYRSTATSAILKRIITQVANATNIIAGGLK